jgi:hypothetical protein
MTTNGTRMTHDLDPAATPSRRRALLLAGLLAACIAAAAIALAAGSSGGGLGPADALAEAAEGTAAVDSGVMSTSIATADGTSLSYVVRFDGADGDAVIERRNAGGDVETTSLRLVDGMAYERGESGTWSARKAAAGESTDELRAEISNRILVDLARSADGVTRDGDVFRARLTAADLIGLESSPLALGGGASPEGAEVEVTAGDDGLLRRVSFKTGDSTHTTTYSELGRPQAVTAPEVAPAE